MLFVWGLFIGEEFEAFCFFSYSYFYSSSMGVADGRLHDMI